MNVLADFLTIITALLIITTGMRSMLLRVSKDGLGGFDILQIVAMVALLTIAAVIVTLN